MAKKVTMFDGWEFFNFYAEECGEEYSHELAAEMVSEDYDMLMDELDKMFDGQDIIMIADIGRWNGRFKAYKKAPLREAMDALTRDCDYDSITIRDEGGHLFISAAHHDATNYAEVKVINKAGEDYYARWDYNEYYDKRSEGDVLAQIAKRYSTLPRAAKALGYVAAAK